MDHDKQGLRSSMQQILKGIPDLEVTTRTSWAGGDYVAVTGTLEGTVDDAATGCCISSPLSITAARQ